MEERDISDLLARYEQMLLTGKSMYFDADEYDDLAEYYDKLDDIETAREIVDLGLSIHPDNEALMLRFGKYLVYDAKYTTALHYLNSRFSSYDFELYLLKIECLLHLDLYAEAYELTAEILSDEDTDLDVILSELGFLYVGAEYYDEAILYFEKSLEYDPNNIEVLNDLAYAYEVKSDFASAIIVCNQILDADPYSIDSWIMLGKLYSLEEDFEKAIDAFDFALALDETNINILKLKAHCLLLSERSEEAIEMLKECIKMSPDESLLYLSLAECYMSLELYKDVLKSLSAYEDLVGETPESMAKKAHAYLLQGKIDEAVEFIDKALNADSDSFDVNMIAGEVYLKLNIPSGAEIFYKKALTLNEENAEEVLEKLVSVYLRKDELLNAIECQERLFEITESAQSHEKLALLYMENGDKENFQSAIESFDDESLFSILSVFYPNDMSDTPSRESMLLRLNEAYECRLLYKNIKY